MVRKHACPISSPRRSRRVGGGGGGGGSSSSSTKEEQEEEDEDEEEDEEEEQQHTYTFEHRSHTSVSLHVYSITCVPFMELCEAHAINVHLAL